MKDNRGFRKWDCDNWELVWIYLISYNRLVWFFFVIGMLV